MLISVFSSGRTGTGYLSQVFGGEYSKRALHINKDTVVTHESWSDIKVLVNRIKTDGYTPEIIKAVNVSLDEKFKELNKQFGTDRYFITDHRVGRFFAPVYSEKQKVIRIRRDSEATTQSILNRFKAFEKKLSPKDYHILYQELWAKSFYHPSDKEFQKPPVLELWNKLSDNDKVLWYVDEVEERWKEFNFDSEVTLEICFEDMFNEGTISKISNFIELPYNKYLITKSANK